MQNLLATASGGGMNIWFIVIYFAIFIAIMYFISIRPQRKEAKQHQELLSRVEIGDYVCTTSGFYGTIIDVTNDMVIVEFGNNKNCRIPMKKAAISDIEKPGQASAPAEK